MRHSGVYAKSGRFYAVYYVNGKAVWKTTGLEATEENRALAVKKLREIERENGIDETPDIVPIKTKKTKRSKPSTIVDSKKGDRDEDATENLSKMFMSFEDRVIKLINDRMNVMSNSFEYIAKVLENSGLSTSNINREQISWQTDMKNIIFELIDIKRDEYPTFNSVVKSVCLKLRNVYGVVIDQLRKEYKNRYGIDGTPDVLEVISCTEMEKNIFESTLRGLFPEGYWHYKDGVVDIDFSVEKTREDDIKEIVSELAKKYNDTTKGYNKTFRRIYQRMNCSWSNLQTRYKNTNNLKATPQKLTIVINNPAVYRKFKKCALELLDEQI